MLHKPGEFKPGPEDWPAGLVSQKGRQWFFDVNAITGTWAGLFDKEAGTIRTEHGIVDAEGNVNLAKYVKLVKDIQRSGVYLQHDVTGAGGQDLTRTFPVKMGPQAERRDPGFIVPRMMVMMEDWFPEGMSYVQQGFIEEMKQRITKHVTVPKGVDPSELAMADTGTTWKQGRIAPFEGATPIDIGLGHGYTQATLTDVGDPLPASKGKTKLSFQFERGGGVHDVNAAMKSYFGKWMIGETDLAHLLPNVSEKDLPQMVTELKRPSMLHTAYWGGRGLDEWATALSTKEKTYTKAEVEKMNWQQVSAGLFKNFWEVVAPKHYVNEDVAFRVTQSTFDAVFPEEMADRITATPVADMPDMLDVIVADVPFLDLESMFMQSRREPGPRTGRLGLRDLQALEQMQPEVYANSMRRGEDERLKRESILRAATSRLSGTVFEENEVVELTNENIKSVVYNALIRASNAKIPGVEPGAPLPEMVQRAVIEEATATFGNKYLKAGPAMIAPMTSLAAYTHEAPMTGLEISPLGRKIADFFLSFEGGSEVGPEQAWNNLLNEQLKLAGGNEFYRESRMSYDPNIYGGVGYASGLLHPEEISIPEIEVLRRYLPEHKIFDAEGQYTQRALEFLQDWRSDDLTVPAFSWRAPSPAGREQFGGTVKVVHPDTLRARAKEQGLALPENAEFVLSEVLAAALQGDFDADDYYALLTGTYENGQIVAPTGAKPFSREDIIELRNKRIMHGRSGIERGKPSMAPGLYSGKDWNDLTPEERLKILGQEELYPEVSAERMEDAMKYVEGGLWSVTGKYYNTLEDVRRVVEKEFGGDKDLMRAANTMFDRIYSPTQTPEALPPGQEKIMSVMSTGTVRGGYVASPGERQAKGWDRGALFKKLSVSGLLDARTHAVLGLMKQDVGENLPQSLAQKAREDWTESVARMLFPQTKFDEARSFLSKLSGLTEEERRTEWYREGTDLAGSLPDWVSQTPFGLTMMASMLGRTGGADFAYKVMPGNMEQLYRVSRMLDFERSQTAKPGDTADNPQPSFSHPQSQRNIERNHTLPSHHGSSLNEDEAIADFHGSQLRVQLRGWDEEESDDLLPSGYRRSEYRFYGATDDDIDTWGLDQPGAPPPDAVGSAVWDLWDEMDADGDGFIDDPFDDPFF